MNDKQSQQGIPITVRGERQLGKNKMSRNTAVFEQPEHTLRKPPWIRVRLPLGNAVQSLKANLRKNHHVTVCEAASCPNIHECFN